MAIRDQGISYVKVILKFILIMIICLKKMC